MVLDAALLNTQHYKVRIKGKVEQSREWSSAFPYGFQLYLHTVMAYEFESYWVALTNLTSEFIWQAQNLWNWSLVWGRKAQ